MLLSEQHCAGSSKNHFSPQRVIVFGPQSAYNFDMPGSSSTSFIPKRSPEKVERRKSPKPVYFGTILVRVIFFLVLVIAGGVFVYEYNLKKDLAKGVVEFEVETNKFTADQSKLDAVIAMNQRLSQANYFLDTSVSLTTLLESLESSTITTIKFDSLNIEQENDMEVKVTANIKTDSFDSTIFQRSILTDNNILNNASFDDISVETSRSLDEKTGQVNEPISFAINIVLDAKLIPVKLGSMSMIVPALDPVVPNVSDNPNRASATEDLEVNVGFTDQDNI